MPPPKPKGVPNDMLLAELPETVLLMRVKRPALAIPPPPWHTEEETSIQLPPVVLPEIVQLMSVAIASPILKPSSPPTLNSPPPVVAELPERVLPIKVKVPSLRMPPP